MYMMYPLDVLADVFVCFGYEPVAIISGEKWSIMQKETEDYFFCNLAAMDWAQNRAYNWR